MIVYGKSGWDIARGKVHGTLDAGLSVITTKPRDGRIDIDSEDCIYHLKVNKPLCKALGELEFLLTELSQEVAC